ncbi:MAG: shikimate dehydrogenase [Ferrovibrio sp.]|uniref:shikimate dehydrogenase n=1 Tax=Ferrovibrio sp. TaxID=1917215 RepID=UPI0026042C47|nr:shikimate dehydrogenase [Ferrovibrio sp.]MCW0233089.1 shikimate dehydrogenase [Ferrovibrio sp.]
MTAFDTGDDIIPRAGVIGWPVDHSRSPKLHGFWLQQHGLTGRYDRLPVPPENLAAFMAALPREPGFRGVNVTIPHKVAVLPYLAQIDPVARRIGAVNTIVVQPDGSLFGSNTDAFGFFESLRAAAGENENMAGWQVAAAPAVVLGAGGAARAIIVALLDAGVSELRLVNRSFDKAESLAAEFGPAITALDWEERAAALGGAGLLVNTTSLGMTGQPALDLPLDDLPRAALVSDIVYTPLETDLLARARARGNPAVDGLGMLLHQGRPGFQAWFGVAPAVTPQLRAAVLA